MRASAITSEFFGLTPRPPSVMTYAAMHKNAPLSSVASLAAILLLSACSGSEQAAAPAPSNDAAMAEEAPVSATPVVLPPSLIASRTYRCKDNSLLYVDFFGDNISADLKTEKTGTAIKLTSAEPNKPLSGGGYTVSGNSDQVQITQPGKAAQSCKA
jgi:hypothetical protein